MQSPKVTVPLKINITELMAELQIRLKEPGY
jgi:hypothetical protein